MDPHVQICKDIDGCIIEAVLIHCNLKYHQRMLESQVPHETDNVIVKVGHVVKHKVIHRVKGLHQKVRTVHP
jgi:hypothetical protein